jgi:hypothetical protein
MIREIDIKVNVINGYGETEIKAPIGKIFFINIEAPTEGYTIEIYTRDKIIYKYENSPQTIVENNITLPLLGSLTVKILGVDGTYNVKIAVEEIKIISYGKFIEYYA